MSATPSACSCLRTWWGEGKGCSGEMWSPLALRPPRSVAPAATSSPHQSARFGGIWMPTSPHQPAGLRDQALHVLDLHRTGPLGQRQARAGRSATPVRQYSPGGLVGDLGGLLAVVALVGHEVLEDHLLDVPVLGVHRGERLERLHALRLGLADADENAAREGDPQLAGRADRLHAPRRMLGGRTGMHRLHQSLGDRLEHQSLRSGDLSQPRQILAWEHTEIGVRQQAPLERPLAGPDHVGGEVLVAVLGQLGGHLGVDLWLLARQHQQLLDLALGRPVEDLDHLLGRVQMGLVRGEGAVLAVAPAGPRQRQRQVAREGDAAPHSSSV